MELEKLQQNDFEAWVPFGEDAEVLIRYVSRDELKSIARKSKKISYVNHQKTEEFDDMKADIELGRAAVKDWKGFTMGGKPLPCTPENIDMLMTKWNAFAKFVNETCIDFEILMQQEREKTIKNSSLTSGQK
ncbi:hypothetical protein A45J_0406 [hot springs metagenome]|uniref:Tail assembly chaperone n=1 Tax=hot springs metagenome TaxID=433727 RepID=A0A5J4KSL4_9ZZZZ